MVCKAGERRSEAAVTTELIIFRSIYYIFYRTQRNDPYTVANSQRFCSRDSCQRQKLL